LSNKSRIGVSIFGFEINQNYLSENPVSNESLNKQRALVEQVFASYKDRTRFKTKSNVEFNANKNAIINKSVISPKKPKKMKIPILPFQVSTLK
jgi:hypothetical protein